MYCSSKDFWRVTIVKEKSLGYNWKCFVFQVNQLLGKISSNENAISTLKNLLWFQGHNTRTRIQRERFSLYKQFSNVFKAHVRLNDINMYSIWYVKIIHGQANNNNITSRHLKHQYCSRFWKINLSSHFDLASSTTD